MERGFLPRGMCSGAFLKLVTPLMNAKIVAWQRSGAGKRLAVLDAETLVRFYRQHFPHSADQVLLASARVAGVALFRDSKSLGSTDAEIVVLRAWRSGGLTRAGVAVDIVAPTIAHGAFCFVLKPEGSFAITGRVALVENPAIFLEFERLGRSSGSRFAGTGAPPASSPPPRLQPGFVGSRRERHWARELVCRGTLRTAPYRDRK